MTLPIKTKAEDAIAIAQYLKQKAAGATIPEAKSALGNAALDGRKVSAYVQWGLVVRDGNRLTLTEEGRALARSADDAAPSFQRIIATSSAYASVIEYSHYQGLPEMTAADVGAHWIAHHRNAVADVTESTLNSMATTFLRVAEAAGLGDFTLGRKGSATRMTFDPAARQAFVDDPNRPIPQTVVDPQGDGDESDTADDHAATADEETTSPDTRTADSAASAGSKPIFIGHGKKTAPLEELKKVLDGLKIPYRVAVGEPNLGRPIPTKVKEIMEECGSAILLLTKDEEFVDGKGDKIWRPSENTVYELGAASFAYDDRIVVFKEEDVVFPANFDSIGRIEFGSEGVGVKTIELISELVGFGLVTITPT